MKSLIFSKDLTNLTLVNPLRAAQKSRSAQVRNGVGNTSLHREWGGSVTVINTESLGCFKTPLDKVNRISIDVPNGLL